MTWDFEMEPAHAARPARLGRRAVIGWIALLSALLAAGAIPLPEARAFVGRRAPDIAGAVWINSSPLSIQNLRGSVVLVEFWTFGCFNCRNVEPQVKAWHQRYADQGLVVVGVHTPEFGYEQDASAVTRYVTDHAIQYPVVTDNNSAIWNRYGNHYWPAMYLVDKRGIIRYVRVGEGGYDDTERMIQTLLAEPVSPQEDER